MRSGANPEKYKEEINIKKQHRVMVVFYIPNTEEDYYLESLKILDMCLDSLVKTINPETTNITLINNDSTPEAESVLNKYRQHIDKYVLYSENKGKVYAVINEARGVFEPFVTISDADILFFSGWESAVFDVFKNHPKAGTVTPLPSQYSAFYYNTSLFFDSFFTRGLHYGKVVADEDVALYLKGIGSPHIIQNKSKYNWKEKQYYLGGNIKAIAGAAHFVATYRTGIFRGETAFPEVKFKNGYEQKFIDSLSDEKGLYRLSTAKTFAYHMGNRIDDFAANYHHDTQGLLDPALFKNIRVQKQYNKKRLLLLVKKAFFKIYKKSKET